MKKLIPYILIAAMLLVGMTGKTYIQTCGKVVIEEETWAAAVSTAATQTFPLIGKCTQIEFDCAENTTNNITFTLEVATADGGVLFTKASLADNGSTILKATSDATDFDAFLAAETVTVTLTPSGAPGATGATVNVGFYME